MSEVYCFHSLQTGKPFRTHNRTGQKRTDALGEFQFPSNGKALSDEGYKDYPYATKPFRVTLFPFPSNGKALSDGIK